MTNHPMTPANDNRPASFDALLMDYLPLIERTATRLEQRPGERADLVQATILWAIENWQNLRFPLGMAKWLYFNMRVLNQKAYRERNRTVADIDGKIAGRIVVPPSQEQAVHFHELMARVRPKDQPIMKLAASGWNGSEIARHFGTTPQAMHSRINNARARLAKVA